MRMITSKMGMAAIAVTLGTLISAIAPAQAFSSERYISADNVVEYDDGASEQFSTIQYPGYFDDDDGYYQPRRRGYYDQRQRGYYDDAPRGYYQQPGYYSNKEALKQQLRDQKEQQKRAIKRGYYNNPGDSGVRQRGIGGNSFD